MNQITAEELQNLRESIKEGDYLTLDGSSKCYNVSVRLRYIKTEHLQFNSNY